MDFARKQLEKYGWSDGKGLGKHEDGISEALKPKLKRSVTGVGHDPASEFNEHWWSALYDKAAKNVEVTEKNGQTKKIKTKDSENFVISSSTWKINKKLSKNTDEVQYSEHFVRTAVLTNDKGGRKTENVREKESEDEEDIGKKDVFKMSDEELFAACGGRTAHKGARHGLRATGKLARIAEQEKILLTQPQYQGYSHAKKVKQLRDESIEQMTMEEDVPAKKQKKKKKRKRCSNENGVQLVESESCMSEEKIKTKMDRDASSNERNPEEPMVECIDEDMNDNDNAESKSKKKKKRVNEDIQEEELLGKIKKKQKKRERAEQMDF